MPRFDLASQPRILARVAPAVLLSMLTAMLAGCGVGGSVAPQSAENVVLSGMVHGGQPPVANAHIALFATSSSGYGGTLTPLATATANGSGNWTISTSYTCPSTQQAYVVATGGNPGQPGTVDNSAIFLVAALGPCSGINSGTFVDIDEVTTVAAAYALSGFAPAGGAGMTEAAITGGSNIPGFTTSSTNVQGLTDAFANVNNIVSYSTGMAYTATPNTNGVVPQATIYALADILQDCVNSTGPTSTACSNLFGAATPPTGSGISAPANVFQAALDIARYPGNNVNTLFGLISAQAAFPTTLSPAPNDWTIGVTYTNSLLASPLGMAIDGSDNVWVSGSTNADLLEFSPQGNVLSPGIVSPATQGGWIPSLKTSKDNIREIAFDLQGNAWLSDGGASSVYEFTPSTTTLTQQSYSAVDTVTNNYGIAIDGLGDAWTASYKKSTCLTAGPCDLVEFAKGASPAYSPYITFSGVTVPSPGAGGARGLAFDASTNASGAGNIWMTDIVEGEVTLFKVTPSASGPATTTSAVDNLQLGTQAGNDTTNNYGAVAVAIDKSSNGWVVVQGGPAETGTTSTSAVPAAIYPVSPTGTVGVAPTNVVGTAAAGGGLLSPAFVAIDGNNNLFIANNIESSLYPTLTTSSIVEYSPSFNSNAGAFISPNIGLSPGATYSAGALSGGTVYEASSVAIDRSGALWVLSSGTGTSPSLANLVQILGVAAPVNPVLAAGQYGVKP